MITTRSYSQEDLVHAYGSERKLGEVFKALEEQAKNEGKVICMFKIDGLVLREQDEVRMAEMKLQEFKILEVESQPPHVLFKTVIENWLIKFPQMVSTCDKLSQIFRQQGPEGSMTAYVQLIDSCQLLVDCLISFDNLLAASPLIQSSKWRDNENLLSDAIGESLKALQKKDFVLIADILEYDLGHSIQLWSELFGALQVERAEK